MGYNSRPSLYETLQIGVEAANSPGTAVAALNLLSGTKAMPAIVTQDQDVVSQGNFAKTDVIINKSHSTLALSGMVDIVDLGVYWLSGIMGVPTTSGNTLTYRYAQTAVTPRNTFSVELGGSYGASRIAGLSLNDLTITLGTSQASTWSANSFGGVYANVSGMSPNPTRRPTRPVAASGVSVFIADTVAALTNPANKLDKGLLLAASFKIDNLSEVTYGIEDVASFSAVTDTQPNIGMQISLVKNSRADALLSQYQASAQKFCRILFNGPTVGGVVQSLELVFPCKLKSPGIGDEANNLVATYALEAIYEAGFGTVLQAKVVQTAVTGSGLTEITTPATTP